MTRATTLLWRQQQGECSLLLFGEEADRSARSFEFCRKKAAQVFERDDLSCQKNRAAFLQTVRKRVSGLLLQSPVNSSLCQRKIASQRRSQARSPVTVWILLYSPYRAAHSADSARHRSACDRTDGCWSYQDECVSAHF